MPAGAIFVLASCLVLSKEMGNPNSKSSEKYHAGPSKSVNTVGEEDLRRREEIVANAEKKYLPLQRESILKLKPGISQEGRGINYPSSYNIGFFGMPAVGKSSLLNAISVAVNGEMPSTHKVQVVPQGFDGIYPTEAQQLRVTDHMCVTAHRGTELTDVTSNREAVLQAIRRQLSGDPEHGLTTSMERVGETYTRNSAKVTHCAVVVMRPAMLRKTNDAYRLLINEIKNFTKSYPVGLIVNFKASEQSDVVATRGFMCTNGINDIYEIGNTHADPLPRKNQIALLDMAERCMYLSDRIYTRREEAD